MTKKAPSTNGSNGDRDDRGRFAQGNSGGPGNPYAKRTAELRSRLLQTVSPDDVTKIMKAIVKKAKDGDLAAAKLLLTYCVGRPVEPVNPDTLDIEARQQDAERIEVDTRAKAAGSANLWESIEPF